MISKLKQYIYNIYGFILLMAMILLSRNTLISSTLIGFKFSFILLCIFSLPILIIFILNIKKYIKYISIREPIFLLMLMIGITTIIKRDWQLYNISILLYILIAFIYNKVYTSKYISKSLIYIVSFLALYSLISNYIVKPILLSNLNVNRYEMVNSVGTVFINLLLAFPVKFNNYIRNFGIFTEPAYYQFYLVISLILILFKNDLINKLILKISLIFILTITLFSTFSIIAYVECFIILLTYLIYVCFKSKKYTKRIIILGVCLLVIFFTIILILYNCNNNIRDMIIMMKGKFNLDNASFSARFGGIINGIKKFFNSPLIGNDISYVINSGYMVIDTNISIMTIYGITAGIILLIMQFKLSKYICENNVIVLLILLIIGISCNNHFFLGVQSFWTIIFLGVEQKLSMMNNYINKLCLRKKK